MKKMKTSKYYVVLLCCCILLLLSCKSSNFKSNKSLTNSKTQQYRIVKLKKYNSKDWDIPEVIKNSTAWLEYETDYFYENDRLVATKTKKFNSKGRSYEYGWTKIAYVNSDSVLVTRKEKFYGENTVPIYRKEFYKNEDYFRSLVPIHPIQNDCQSVEHSKKDYKIHCSDGEFWCCSFHYFLNDEGYIIKSAITSDVEASIDIYEYELGHNPYYFCYTFNVAR